MYSVEELRDNYRNFSDSKIERIAINDSKSLRRESLAILKEEIVKRNLDYGLITWVEAETFSLPDRDKQSLIIEIENLPCPNCQKKEGKLNGYEINQFVSILIFTKSTTQIKILCVKCGKREKLISILFTFLFGWWSGHGFFITPYKIIKDLKNLFYQQKVSNQIIQNFIEANIGLIRLHGAEVNTLFDLVVFHNNNYEIKEGPE